MKPAPLGLGIFSRSRRFSIAASRVSKALKAEYVMQGAPKASSITRAKRPSRETRQNSTGKRGPVGSRSAMTARSLRSQTIEPQARTDILNLRTPLRSKHDRDHGLRRDQAKSIWITRCFGRFTDLLTPRLVANPFSAMHMGHGLGRGVGRGFCSDTGRGSPGGQEMLRSVDDPLPLAATPGKTPRGHRSGRAQV